MRVIRDGSLRNRNSWRLLAELVASNESQCWLQLAAIVNHHDPNDTAINRRLERETRDVL